jgi:hypothetical protein
LHSKSITNQTPHMKSLVILLLLNALALSAQPSIQWQKTFGGSHNEEVRDVLQTKDGGYIMVGQTTSSDGDVVGYLGGFDTWIIKVDPEGKIIWKNIYGGTNNDWPYSLEETEDEGFIVSGWTRSNDLDVSGNHGDRDAWLFKLSKNGVMEWQKCYGGSGRDDSWCVTKTNDGGYIMAGSTNSVDGDVSRNIGSEDYWVVKVDSLGEIEWEKSYGGTMEDYAYSVKQALDGGYYVAGESASKDIDVVDHRAGDDYWIVKLSSVGELEWTKSFGGTSSDRCNDVYACTDGGCIAVGQTSSDNGDIVVRNEGQDICAVKLSASGEVEWHKTLGSNGNDWGHAVQQTPDGGYIIAGLVEFHDGDVVAPPGSASMWAVKLNPSGQIEWQKAMGGSLGEIGFAIDQTTDGGCVVAGMTFSNDGDVTSTQAQSNFWIVKLSPVPVSGSEEPGYGSLQAFPNPAGDYLTLQVSAEGTSLTASICDAQGRVLLQENVVNGSQLNVGALPSGLYFVRALGEGGAVYVGRFSRL